MLYFDSLQRVKASSPANNNTLHHQGFLLGYLHKVVNTIFDAKYFYAVKCCGYKGFASVDYIIMFKFKLFFLSISLGYKHLNM